MKGKTDDEDLLWDELADRFNSQPRPNDYADDAGYDEAAYDFIANLASFIKSRELAAQEKALDMFEQDMKGYDFDPEDEKWDINKVIHKALEESKEYVLKEIKSQQKGTSHERD